MVEAVPEAAPVEEPADAWGVDPGGVRGRSGTGGSIARRVQVLRQPPRRNGRVFCSCSAACLHLTGVGLVASAWALGAFNSSPPEETNPPTQKQDEPHKTPKKQRQNPPG